MKRFEVGQKVIALSDNPCEQTQPRTKGRIYTVKAVIYTMCCGEQGINVAGGVNPRMNIFCQKCHARQPSNGLWWTASRHFAPVEEIDDLINKAIEVEDYEMAHELTKTK